MIMLSLNCCYCCFFVYSYWLIKLVLTEIRHFNEIFQWGLILSLVESKEHTFFCRREQRGKKREKRVESKSMASELMLRALLKTQSEDTRTDVHCAGLPGQQMMFNSPWTENMAEYNVFLIWIIIIIIYEILLATVHIWWLVVSGFASIEEPTRFQLLIKQNYYEEIIKLHRT